MNDIAIVIPSYNEGKRLLEVLKKIRQRYTSIPIVIVDDGSFKKVKVSNPKTTVLRHNLNLGKSAALKTGAEFVFKELCLEVVIFMDADGQHNPNELPKFIKSIREGYDLLLGCRKLSNNVPLVRLLGNKFSSVYLNLMFGVYVSDTLCGFRALTKRAYTKVIWQSPHYGVEPEMIANLGKHKNELKFKEIEIETIYLDKYKGVTIIDALQILIHSLWWKLF